MYGVRHAKKGREKRANLCNEEEEDKMGNESVKLERSRRWRHGRGKRREM